MIESKVTYWLLIAIGILSVAASLYLYFSGQPFSTYFSSGLLGLIFAVLGASELNKRRNKEDKS